MNIHSPVLLVRHGKYERKVELREKRLESNVKLHYRNMKIVVLYTQTNSESCLR